LEKVAECIVPISPKLGKEYVGISISK